MAYCTHITVSSDRPLKATLLQRLRNAFALRHERLALAALDDHILNDIGVTRQEAKAEAELPPWDAPRHWHG